MFKVEFYEFQGQRIKGGKRNTPTTDLFLKEKLDWWNRCI